MLQNKFLELIVTISIDDKLSSILIVTISIDDKLSSTFCIVQSKYQKNIRISDFQVNYFDPIIP